ncbi:unnamed protein product [Acanthoscelides obtectus]|uniref:Uncharacterized protein n=1 Tax=Acanthoscelides obtectus TaxID=200917 RepID=A0A9P0JPM7_ACAOB|nr:unnamed protein product [Acanthoscelides obtectus]CAK1666974.1 hypothetical protein AOBTE_LOCUS25588 [Acanthoscelides obtectus]
MLRLFETIIAILRWHRLEPATSKSRTAWGRCSRPQRMSGPQKRKGA